MSSRRELGFNCTDSRSYAAWDVNTTFAKHLYALAAGQIAWLKSLDDASKPAVLLDLGTCDGRSTAPCFRECARHIRERDAGAHPPRPQRPVVAIFEDHRHNEWSPLLTRDLKHELGEGVFPLVSNTSFYEEVTAPGSVDLAFSNCAMHFLASSEPPGTFQKALRHVTADASLAEDAAAIAAFRATAAADWQRLLLCRAAELKPGGRLVVSSFAVDERTGFHWGHGGTGASIYHVLAECVQGLVRDGLLTSAEQRRATSPAYYRSLAEFTAPVLMVHRAAEDGTAPELYQSNWHLFPAHTKIVPLAGGAHMDFGDFVVGSSRQDLPGSLGAERQQQLTAQAILDFLSTALDTALDIP